MTILKTQSNATRDVHILHYTSSCAHCQECRNFERHPDDDCDTSTISIQVSPTYLQLQHINAFRYSLQLGPDLLYHVFRILQ